MKIHALKAGSAGTWLAAGLLTWSLACVGACSSKDDNPSPSKGGRAGAGGSGGAQSGGARNTGGTGETAGAPGDAGTGGAAEEGGAGPTGGMDAGGAPNQGGASGGEAGATLGGSGGDGSATTCPATDLGFLNRPSNSQHSAFPNTKARLPLLKADGTLPPLPGS